MVTKRCCLWPSVFVSVSHVMNVDLALVSWAALLGTGGLLFVQSLADVLARRRFRYSVAMPVGSISLLVGVGMDALNAGGDPGDNPSMATAVLTVAGFVAVALGTTWRFAGRTHS
jgi:hypothetical protein